ncbi:MAG: ribosome biogenesis GTPase Der [Bacteroidetes bacterium]|nr:ribosome biogenesis GTPase Der [Bacteroidota bacterium]MBL7103243.1 ribosome biogenesis GTPase Der [Bacteroidales bacterium]
MSNILAIVGRPNVGKSTFFNRLTETRQAIVEETSGVTRDRHYGKADWNGVEFSVIDTGGYVVNSDDVFEEEIRKQVQLAIDEADAIVFMVDVKAGLMGMDEDVANVLRKTKKDIFLVANKVDNPDRINEAGEFYELGLGNVFSISSINGSGTGDLLDEIVKVFDVKKIDELPDVPKFAIIGRPNVGKSSLVNAFLGDERNIVTPVAGTTRDSVYTRYNSFGFDFLLVDTAGLRKKGKVHENIEFYSVMRSIRAIENSDICFLMVDAKEGFEAQDLNIFRLVERNRKGVVIVVNKWDLIEKASNTHLEFENKIREKIAPFSDVSVVFTSIPKKQRIYKALEIGAEVYKNRSNRISTSKLNELLLPIIEKKPPPSVKGKYIKIKYITQLKTAFPAFVFFCNFPQYVKDPYKRFVENQLRKHFEFTGAPVQIYFRKK